MSRFVQFITRKRTRSAGSRLLTKAGPALLALVLVCAMLGGNFTSAAAVGTTYYVDKTNIAACSDTGPGSAAAPFCTLTKAANTAVLPGDTVNVVHGSYAETVYPASGTAGNPITFHAVNSDVTVTGDTAFGAGFAITSRSYVVIDGFTVYHTKGRGIYVDDSNHITITNNHVSYSGADTSATTHAEGIFLSGTTYSTVSHNVAEHNSCIGIRLIASSNFNEVSDNSSYSNASDIAWPNVAVSDAAGIDVTDSNNNTILHNIVHGNEDTGINMYIGSLAAGASNNFIVGNLSYSNGDHGIDNNGSPNNIIVGNTVQGNHTSGINLEASSGGATLANNIAADNGRAPTGGRKAYNIYVDATSTAGTTMDYDLVFLSPGATTQIKWGATGYTSMADFQASPAGQEVAGLQGNPLFVAPAAYNPAALPSEATGNYHIQAGSPAIDSANPGASHEASTDLDGNPRVGVDDRGAYEYQSGSAAPTVTTQAVDAITTTTATGHGTVTALGIPNPTQHGVVWDTAANPDISLPTKTTDGPVSAIGAFTSAITGLTPGTLYHVRAYATNSMGTVYGSEVTFTSYLLPTVTTQDVTNIADTTATGNGNVTALGIPNPTQHGVVWGTAANPDISLLTKTTDGPVSAIGAFTSAITGLTPGTLYHVRAYATNGAGTAYGADVTFTSYKVPTVTTQAVTAITDTTATGHGNVTSLGVPNPTEHGVVWSTAANPDISLLTKTADGPVSAIGAFTSAITGLTPGTLYHVRAYATNSMGTAYGADVTFTSSLLPTVTTQDVTNIADTTATGNGNVTALGVPNPTQHGVVWGTAADPTVALPTKTADGPVSAIGAFTSAITGLTPGTLYHVRAYATNSMGTAYGADVTFTSYLQPTVTTQDVTAITDTTATANGNVTALGIPNPTEHGVVWSTATGPTIADSHTSDGAVSAPGAFTSSMTGLTPSTLYYVRAYATNATGTVYGSEVTFTTQRQNAAPVITEGTAKTVIMSVNAVPTKFLLTLHATDGDLDILTWTISTPALHGTASVPASNTGNEMAIGYSPAKNYFGKDSFVVTADDGFGGTDTITVNVTVSPRVASFKSVGTYDGWVLESGELTNQGNAKNSVATTFSLGDDKAKKQYRGILSFNTVLPAGAKITSVTLKIQTSSTLAIANSMFKTFGNIVVDLKKGSLGAIGLEVTDFQNAATKNGAFLIKNAPVAGWYSGTMGAPADTLINKTGVTQLRLRFTLDDNNNLIANILNFYSGNAPLANRPVLTIQYYVPLP